MRISWAKGHGTENDFVLLPDPDGTLLADLAPEFVAALCDRRRGIGADGIIRVVRSRSAGFADAAAEWFMDYRNADGGVSEMCGNGIRVLARYLADQGLIASGSPVAIQTRAGVKTVLVEPERVSVDMGKAEIGGTSKVTANGRVFEAREVHTGNPHAVAFVETLDDAGPLHDEPEYDRSVYPEGVNVEFVRRLAAGRIAMRVYERGSGETRSCGTGACAAAIVALGEPGVTTVSVPGGELQVDWSDDGTITLIGPAVMIATGEMEWLA
jgi:diaminopimelate epimerase